MVNIDERARRSSDSSEPRPEHIPDSLTPEISEDRNQSLNILERQRCVLPPHVRRPFRPENISDSLTSQISQDRIQSLNPDRSEYPFCVLPPDPRGPPRRNKQEVSSDFDSSPEVSDSDGQSKEIDRSKGYRCRKGWVKARPANFGKGKEIFAEYKEKFKALYEEMINHTLLAENLTLPGRVCCTDLAREEAIQILLEELKKEHNYPHDLEDDSHAFSQVKQFIGFDVIEEGGCGGYEIWVPPLDEQPLAGEESPRKRPVMVREGGDPDWLY